MLYGGLDQVAILNERGAPMNYRLFRLMSICITLLVVSAAAWTIALADDGNAVTTILTNLRTGSGTTYPVAAVVDKGIPVIIESRNADMSWILVHTQDNSARGWGKTSLFSLGTNFKLSSIGISEEII